MKTRSIINITSGIATMISARISGVIERAINELRAMVDVPEMETRRVRVPVRVQRSEFSDRPNY